MFVITLVTFLLKTIRVHSYTGGFDGVKEWIAICLTPADRKDV